MQKAIVKNILTVVGISLIVLSFGVGIYLAFKKGFLGPKIEANAEPFKVKITNVSINKFTVSWLTNAETYGEISFGKDSKLGSIQVDDQDQLGGLSKKHIIHYVTVDNLQPATQYFFKIKTGEKKIAVGKDHQPYQVKTAPALGSKPPNKIINGQVEKSPGVFASGQIVYFNIKGASPLSAQVRSEGSWSIDLSNAYNSKYTKYIDLSVIDSAKILVQGKKLTSSVTLGIGNNDQIVPIVILGNNYDFNQLAADNFTNDQAYDSNNGSIDNSNYLQNNAQDQPVPLQQFPVEPGKAINTSNGDSVGANYVQQSLPVTIVYPASEGEIISSTKPEFKGSGSSGKLIIIDVLDSSDVSVSSTTMVINSDSTWSFVPDTALVEGDYIIQVKYSDNGVDQIISSTFTIDLAGTGGDTVKPAFEASKSATPSPTAKPRVSIPSTHSGVPTSGVALPTLMMMMIGMMMLGMGLTAKGWID